ncbi:alpha/beta fold hydrolase [Novosphingobium colocasiae]|uniref:Epoxide hydrolase n=2 Tax=Bacteria TaxID=2 RepID=A0A918PAX5_9SPHN|nr:alpha/beta hydrolase [Novosphingobium colocasiae]GGY96829.1 epoxide hydrolase [Novosphingobium colocasiae]
MSHVDCDPQRFAVHRTTVRDNVEIAYVREGIGGVPLLLLHGWPGSKRLFWRNIAPLAAMGFEVIVPDQRGIGDSPIVADHPLTIAESAQDMHALMQALGHETCVGAAGDFGSIVMLDIGKRFPGFLQRQVLYNGGTPDVADAYLAAGLPASILDDVTLRSDHFTLHGAQADELVARLAGDADRLAYVESFFLGTHEWREGDGPVDLAGPGNFTPEAARFQAETMRSADRLRASLDFYACLFGELSKTAAPPMLAGPATIETMVLWGMADGIVASAYPAMMTIGCTDLVGPLVLPGVGHFVPWEAATIFNNVLRVFCRDLLGAR